MTFLDEECRMKDDDNVHPPAASTHSESARLLPRGMLTTTDFPPAFVWARTS